MKFYSRERIAFYVCRGGGVVLHKVEASGKVSWRKRDLQ